MHLNTCSCVATSVILAPQQGRVHQDASKSKSEPVHSNAWQHWMRTHTVGCGRLWSAGRIRAQGRLGRPVSVLQVGWSTGVRSYEGVELGTPVWLLLFPQRYLRRGTGLLRWVASGVLAGGVVRRRCTLVWFQLSTAWWGEIVDTKHCEGVVLMNLVLLQVLSRECQCGAEW